MTVDEIKRKLDALGVEYLPDARKTELEQLLAEAAEDAATAPETPASDPEPDPAEPGTEIGPRPRTVATDAGALNIRREPGGAVLIAVPDGTELTAIGDPEDGWQRVVIEAWAKAEFLAG